MGIDTSSQMIIGAEASKIKINEDIDCIGDWADDNGMVTMSPYYDSSPDEWLIGFPVADVEVEKIALTWIHELKQKAKKFEELTGVKAKLIGALNVF